MRNSNFSKHLFSFAHLLSYLIENGVIDPQTEKNKDRVAAEKALALDEKLAEAHLALARIKTNDFDWIGAESSFRRAIELNPNLASAHGAYANYLSNLGKPKMALNEIKLAQQLDPLSANLISKEGAILCFARRYDETLTVLKGSVEMEPNIAYTYAFLGITYTAKGQYEDAIRAWELGNKHSETLTITTLIYLGQAYAKSGNRQKAVSILEKLKKTSEYVSPVELAILYTALGDKEKPFTSLEKAYVIRDIQLQFLKVEPGLDDLRDDLRFQDLLRHIGMN
jgi:serine/threonine-protein kinase